MRREDSTPTESYHGLAGLWRYLITKVEARKELDLEDKKLERQRERSRSITQNIALLPMGTQLMDYEVDGRQVWIRMPDTPPDRRMLIVGPESELRLPLPHNEDAGPVGEVDR